MLSVAVEIAREAGTLALAMRDRIAPTEKRDGTWVTEADQAAEQHIRRRLATAFPDHLVIGEEMGGSRHLAQGYQWVVDPIDGTNNFVTGLPTWGVSLGMMHDGVPAIGVVYLPATDDLFTARVGGGAHLNGVAIAADARGVVDANSLFALNSDACERYEVTTLAKLRNLGSTAAHLCYVASGALCAAAVDRWWVWDIAAGLCLCREAGARTCYLDGTELTTLAGVDPFAPGAMIVVGPPHALAELRPVVHRKAGGAGCPV